VEELRTNEEQSFLPFESMDLTAGEIVEYYDLLRQRGLNENSQLEYLRHRLEIGEISRADSFSQIAEQPGTLARRIATRLGHQR
jgi:hypothetical protein